ncbi:alpha/beta hydrolase [Streptomyces sp. NPDC029526]|uniref:alpha/beta fold hydrolase n=1 Tax=Streptomyces sp. NPDC029526 TaxID=3155728 RepID=UPI0033F082B5
MTRYVMVAGAWLGGWAWDEVAAHLAARGHEVRALTLSGLAERAGVPADQQTHVRDVVEEVDRLGPGRVVLVGHSYSGIPVGQAAERIGDRLSRVVYVDANVPVDGETFLSGWPSEEVRRTVAEHGGVWPPPPAGEFAGQGLSEEQIARITARATPHPGATLTGPAALRGAAGDLPATYVKCLLDGGDPPPAAATALAAGKWELVRMDTGHWPMFSRPGDLARILHEAVPSA